ncbi:hypothetical protein BC939DRAFT_498474 [Gamsiella multidivaricata]|uniref:uncharacterized protein n=1 Tax=Gamsiella multidivaricata TaxID=101098 RepID=UPI00221F6BA1|nr:uncharacterized protein BC939DRAFT_498474 [Gamsiella multidivaricata]KAI7832396.1 hypothetical protein BC939DRAFT_498474 [Gamsiella multidivaricata]
MPFARYLEGTAYILYAPPFAPERTNDATNDSTANDHQHQHQHHCQNHEHHRNGDSDDPQPHFWVVFRPDSETPITSGQSNHQQIQHHQGSDKESNSRLFVLKGTPHPWGSYPEDVSEPHGCIPPHLYYHVTISEHHHHYHHHHQDNDKTAAEWTLPYVHRIGDGKDDAGGLTTCYKLLEDLEDADDFGYFIQQILERSGSYSKEPLSPLRSSPTTETTTPAAELSSAPSLYACTELLISEKRTPEVIEQQFFSWIKSGDRNNSDEALPRVLSELLSDIAGITSTTEPSRPRSSFIVKSDLKLILPHRIPGRK